MYYCTTFLCVTSGTALVSVTAQRILSVPISTSEAILPTYIILSSFRSLYEQDQVPEQKVSILICNLQKYSN